MRTRNRRKRFVCHAHTESNVAANPAIVCGTESLLVIQRTIAGGLNVSKYRNRLTTLDGIVFDSAKEARRFAELRLLERAGAISDLQRQVAFTLIPAQKEGGKTVERAVKYIADFVYKENGETVVEDAKGVRTKEYILKRKILLWEFGIRIREV